MPDYQYLGVTMEEKVCLLTISNPPANLLSKGVLTEINGFLDGVAKDPNVKVLILTGAGTFFVVGADIKEISEISGAAAGQEAATLGQKVFNKLERLPIPTIAAINGHCLGGGNEMVMACTIRIANERSRIGQPEINLGIMPGFGGTQRLARIVGKSKALELNLTGDMINGKTAEAIGGQQGGPGGGSAQAGQGAGQKDRLEEPAGDRADPARDAGGAGGLAGGGPRA